MRELRSGEEEMGWEVRCEVVKVQGNETGSLDCPNGKNHQLSPLCSRHST